MIRDVILTCAQKLILPHSMEPRNQKLLKSGKKRKTKSKKANVFRSISKLDSRDCDHIAGNITRSVSFRWWCNLGLFGVCDNKVASVTDVSNFDIYPPDNTVPPDDLTGWDKDF